MAAGMGKPHDLCNWRGDHSLESLESPDSIGSKRNLEREKGTSLNSDSLAPKPLASTGLTHHNSEAGLYGRFCIPSKPRLLPYSLATFR